MKQEFIEWLNKHKDEYDIKIIENPTEEQKERLQKDYQDFKNWLDDLKNNANK